ncbi:MAG: thioredoxin domain-containing protein [Sphingobacteriaceae bacterium]|nr:thioredoxin domain-containing protein [Sphingobacteriaceae bacterium]
MHTNELINETSPYLLQHAHNPVNWVAWNESVLKQAKAENKLILVSVGYSACHWCHVMEHESFEDEKVAEIMNKHFICIKVDREERPDVDMLYMTAVQLMNGQGGWPLNCFTLPDGRPIYGGTYFRKEQWINILLNLSGLYEENPEKVMQYATELTNGLHQTELINTKAYETQPFNKEILEKCILNWEKRFDNELGGPKKAPKFPIPNNYSFLLKHAHLTNDSKLLKHVELTLNKMACGGIYDQLGGGFARYSTDIEWKIPHFEKMLYDNAQLVTLYCEAYRLTKNNLYKQIVKETLSFIEREWLSKENGFYSALDADSEGEEGKYYVWQKEELESLLGKDFDVFADYYGINDIGYWEHDNYVWMRNENVNEILFKHQIKIAELESIITNCKTILLKERDKRVKPGLDDKILTAWNALMCKAYGEAYLTFKNTNYKTIALQNAEFLKQNMVKSDFSMCRNFKNGKANINAFLDDYAFSMDAFIQTYIISQDESWLNLSKNLCDYVLKNFYNAESGLFYYTDLSNQLIVRSTETSDNVIPASNSQMAHNLFKLGKYFNNIDYEEKSVKMLNRFTEEIVGYGAGYSNWASLYSDLLNNYYEVCVVGKDVDEKILDLYNHYVPNAIFVVAASGSELDILKQRFVEGKTLIYVCKNKACLLPVSEVKEAMKQLEATT